MKKSVTHAVTLLAAIVSLPLNAQNMETEPSKTTVRNPQELSASYASQLQGTDPELIDIIDRFVIDETFHFGNLELKTRYMAILASTIATQSLSQYGIVLQEALRIGITPVEAKEVLYQAVPYVGLAKVWDFVHLTNAIFSQQGIVLPLEASVTAPQESRFDRGIAVQKEIFGAENIDNLHKNAPTGQEHIQRYLSANCFGDFVARDGLDLKTREMLTFSMLLSLGGCESQLKGHIQGNVNRGNDKEFLLAVVTQLIPYVGYPRALNAIACLNEVIPE